MKTLSQDIRYTLRGFRRTPLFTAVAILSLAFGIGANAAIFSLVDQVLLKLLPVKDPQQLVLLSMQGSHYGSNWGMNAISYPMYADFRDHNTVFSGMFCRFPIETSLGYGSHTERMDAELVSGSYFPVLGVKAAIGRTIGPEDDRVLGGEPFAVLSYNFWQSRFAGSPGVVGKTITINGHGMTIIGVAQAGFDGVELGHTSKVFIPIMMKAQMTPYWDGMKDRRMRWVNAFGRLKPGITIERAKASLQPFMHSMLEMEVKEAAFRNASDYTRKQFLRSWMDVLPGSQGRSELREQLSKPLWLLIGITGAVLLLACANLANLLIARATAREREFAIRLAIGAGRGRIIRQLLVESFVLSACGAAVGLLLAFWADRLLLTAYLSPEAMGDLTISAVPDARVLGFTFCLTLLTVVIFGLLPALRSSRAEIAGTLKDQAGSVITGNVTLRKVLVAVQVMLSLLLLVGAGLFVKTLSNLRTLGPGFPIEKLVGFNIDPSQNGYSSDRAKAFYRQLSEELTAIPGVRSVGFASMRILEDNEWDSSMTVEGYTAKPGQSPEPYMNSISPNYFATLEVPIIEGRDFTVKDTQQVQHERHFDPDSMSPATVMINEAFAKKYFAGRNPIGLHVGFGSDPGTKTDMEVIGVVKDIKYTNLRDTIPPQAYVPYLADSHVGGMTVYLRTELDPKQLLPVVRRKVQELDPNLPLYEVRTTTEQIDLSLRTERLVASLSAVFGILATLIAVIGLYGVMAYTVARRTREIGIRMALGAIRANVIAMVMREALLLIAAGILVGLPCAIALSTLVQNQLFGLQPTDPLTLALATVALSAVAGLAGLLPAMRASKIDPTQALRYE